MVNLQQALCIEAIGALQQAADALLDGNERQAWQLVMMLPAEAYELALSWYDRCPQDFLYFMARYVFAGLECDSEQRPASEFIRSYRERMLDTATTRPARVFIKQKAVEIDWEQLVDEPLEGYRLYSYR